MKRELDTRENIRTVTSNQFITACGLENISLKGRKLLYIAISQCQRTDKEFYEYEISIQEFADLMGIDASNVYQEALKISTELMKGYINIQPEGTKDFEIYTLFQYCKYKDGKYLCFKLNRDMTDFLLSLTGNFSKPLLHDFLRMKSKYSMAIWHLMQMKMKSKKLGVTATTGFDLYLDELRKVTGTENKFKTSSHFKQKVFDKAIREIFDCAGIKITYENIKEGRTVIGFKCFAEGVGHIDLNKIPLAEQERIQANAERLKKGEPLL